MENNTFENYSAPEANDFQETFTANEQPVKIGNIIDKIKAIPKKFLIAGGACIAALVLVIVLLSSLSNNYKTPIKTVENLLNTKSLTKIINKAPTVLNGFGESDAKKALKIIKKSDVYKDNIDELEEGYDDLVENLKDEYGKNYKIKLKVEDKEKLEKKELRNFRDQLRNIADMGEELDDMDSDDYEDLADELGVSKAKAKKLVKLLKGFTKDCKKAKVTKGYELDVSMTITGKDADDVEPMEFTVRVYKVDGRWVLDVFSLVQEIGIGALGSLVGDFGF